MSPLIFRYVARLFLTLFAGTLSAALVIFLLGDFGDRWEMFLDKEASDVAWLYFNKLLVAAHQLCPAAMLLAAGAAVSTLRKRGEWIALQSVGASRWAVVAPIALCAAVLAGGLVAWDELVVTKAGTRIDRMLVEKFRSWGDYRFYYFPKQWFRVGDHVFHVRGEADADGALRDVTVYALGQGFELDERLDAERFASLGGDRWLLSGVVGRRFGPGGESPRVEHAELALTVPGTTPDTFRVRVGRPELMPVKDLLQQQQIRAGLGLRTERFWLALHNRFAYPFTGLAAALLAVTLALRPARRGHLTVAVVEGLVVAVALFGLMMTGKTLVLAEHLPPAAAAWGPFAGLLLAVAGLWLHAEGRLARR